ncbi:formate/nitrite transporter family protein [Oleiagrimonas sp. C23AA]|uniref:formate/nitrite transporter family protein n=1 Tax=Oleiagrimonas sp. C23AA TaxID=2719047 RepID=UPI001420BB61|nr:formate/nitrite transporter family protein [Oleiagrimonas sp. C23AA]NII09618.1 formate/nitrite transporter family protein [Oleiagrimonas sp. C23AA]
MSGPGRSADEDDARHEHQDASAGSDDNLPPSPEEEAEDGFELSEDEQGEVAAKLPPRPTVLHETIRVQGETELRRHASALIWSSLAAGLSMGFSMMARGLLHSLLPPSPLRYLIENLGYTVGFVIVILARQQLFTENTMSAVLPMMTHPGWRQLARLLRLWSVVLMGNLVGVALFAYGLGHLDLFDASTRRAMGVLGTEVMHNDALQMFTKGIVAGWLIATMVWLIPAAGDSKLAIIVGTTYLIGLGGFTHIIAGSTEVLYLVFQGQLGLGHYLAFALPTLAGNIVGGSFIFALISHAQVRSDQGG